MNPIYGKLIVLTQEYLAKMNDLYLLRSIMEDNNLEYVYIESKNKVRNDNVPEENLKNFLEMVKDLGLEKHLTNGPLSIRDIDAKIKKIESEIFDYLMKNKLEPLVTLILESKV